MAKDTQKITVYLGKDLMERYDEYRNEINVSELVQQALKARISTLRKLKDESPEKKRALKRLQIEKEELKVEDREMGYDVGLNEALDASLRDLRATVKMSQSVVDKLDSGKVSRPLELLPDWSSAADDDPDLVEIIHEDEFVIGWFKGIQDFWKKNKDKI